MALLLNANDSVNRSYTITKPSPNHPLNVNGVGVRTENLFNATWESGSIGNSGGNLNDTNAIRTVGFIACEAEKLYSFSPELDITETWVNYYDNNNGLSRYKITNGTFTTPQGCTRLRFRLSKTDIGVSPVPQPLSMLNVGTPLPYEPYGYKIPISNGQQTTNIYLRSTSSTRQIRKYTFDGTQSIYSCVRTADNQNYCCAFRFSDIGMTDIKDYDAPMSGIDYPIFISDRFVNKDSSKRAHYNNVSAGEMGTNNTNGGMNRYVIFCVSGLTTAEDYKQWFTEHPTTIYYILATVATAAVNEPLMKIGDYSDTLSNAASIPTTEGANSITVDTTVQPSEFTATWTGWHDSSVKEWVGSQWD